MHNILVVGINGIIGSALFSHLKKMKLSTWGSTHRKDRQSDPTIFYLNLLDPPSTWDFKNIKFDVVYLCAGVCRMLLCETDPITSHKVNVEGMFALTRYLSETGAYIVYLSTNQVFSGEQPFAKADAAYSPLNEYGHQKSKIETLIRKYGERWAIVRLTKVMTPNMELISHWIKQLSLNQTIEAFYDMMLAPVSIKQVINLLLSLGQKKLTGCFQVSGINDVSYYDMANYISQIVGKSSSLIKSVSALDKGIKKSFLPLFTTLDCSSMIAVCDEKPLAFQEVLQECFPEIRVN